MKFIVDMDDYMRDLEDALAPYVSASELYVILDKARESFFAQQEFDDD